MSGAFGGAHPKADLNQPLHIIMMQLMKNPSKSGLNQWLAYYWLLSCVYGLSQTIRIVK